MITSPVQAKAPQAGQKGHLNKRQKERIGVNRVRDPWDGVQGEDGHATGSDPHNRRVTLAMGDQGVRVDAEDFRDNQGGSQFGSRDDEVLH